jgi:hypothetical protein
MLGELKRRLYAGNQPGRIATALNCFWARIHACAGRLSKPPRDPLGRRAGRLISLPLVMAVVDGQRDLASMLVRFP